MSPIVWDVRAVEIQTVRDGRRVLVVQDALRGPADLPVWLTHAASPLNRRFLPSLVAA